MLTRRAAVVGVAVAAVLAVTACEPLDTGASGSHSTVKSGSHSTAKSGKTTKKSGTFRYCANEDCGYRSDETANVIAKPKPPVRDSAR